MAFRNSMSAVRRFPEAGARLVADNRSYGCLALVLLACSLSATAAELDRIRTMALAGSVFKVEAIKVGGGYSLGTAVSVGPGKFVTNCHVTRDAEIVMLVRGGARWRAASERADLFLDLCLLQVPGLEGVPAVPLTRARDLHLAQEVAAAGYTGGGGLQMHAGTVSALHDLNGSKVIQTTTAFTSGASGGALFDAQGKLAGILTFRLRGADGYYFAAPVEWIADRIDNPDGYVAVAPLNGPPPFWAQPVASLPFFMQAASLEVDGRWNDLLTLTDRWTQDEQRNPEPWFLRGNSYAKLDRVDSAVGAYRNAVALDPLYTGAWLNLGKAYVKLGALDDARNVTKVLRNLDADLADQLAASVEPPSP